MPLRGVQGHPHRHHKPDNHIPRPRTTPGFQQPSARNGSVKQAVNNDDEAVAEEEAEEEQIELLEYEWPDLPPISSLKDAVSRRRVSQGISYLLPVDKGRNSINNRFRTDLRAMFQEPYASDDLQYDDNRVKLSAKVHFRSNTADTKWTPHLLHSIPVQLNADSESARKLYVHSAPSGGVASRRMGIDPNKLRKRSNLFLPVKASKAQVSPEIMKLRQEAVSIIKQGLTFHEDDDSDNPDLEDRSMKNKGGEHQTTTAASIGAALFTTPGTLDLQPPDSARDLRKVPGKLEGHLSLLATYGGSGLETLGASSLNAKLQSVRIQQEQFANYQELRNATPPKPVIPHEITSPFLSPEDNQRIWDWLHYGESMSAFDYFLSVCG